MFLSPASDRNCTQSPNHAAMPMYALTHINVASLTEEYPLSLKTHFTTSLFYNRLLFKCNENRYFLHPIFKQMI